MSYATLSSARLVVVVIIRMKVKSNREVDV